MTKKNNEPCIVIIFGATGDLTSRKLLPALYNLAKEKQMPGSFACVGFARREKTNEQFREETWKDLTEFSRTKPAKDDLWKDFSERLFYHISDFDKDEGYIALGKLLKQLDDKLGTKGNRLFYLSTQPSYFPLIVEKLKTNNLVYDETQVKDRWSRVVIEKPFGHDLKSAEELQKNILQHLSEDQIYRIDHYLGKETVQNLLVFRLANSFFESLWQNRFIDHVQITVAEEIGIGTRGRFYEEAGILRDIIQNHMMQLLALVAMEPPVNLSASAIRDEKVKVLNAIRPFPLQQIEELTVRGQYGPGDGKDKEAIAYRSENNVSPTSNTETFAAMKLYIDNWRWFGVPFYLRAGKRMKQRCTEIVIFFKKLPDILFKQTNKSIEGNALVIRIQPNEGISLKINCKVPGPSSPVESVRMDFRYDAFFGQEPPEAYERLICDAILGDGTLFIRWDEVLAAWRLLTPLLDFWHAHPCKEFPNYTSGSWGPKVSDEMLAKDGREWVII